MPTPRPCPVAPSPRWPGRRPPRASSRSSPRLWLATPSSPAGVAQALAAKLPAVEDPDWITHEELRWLSILVDGGTVHDLAEKVDYSERALYRLFHALYGRLGVSNRTEAILQASRRGLLD